MGIVACGEWIVNFKTKTCWNFSNNVVVAIESSGKTITGKIKDMPVTLKEKLSKEPGGDTHIKNMIFQAEKIFRKLYFEHELENFEKPA